MSQRKVMKDKKYYIPDVQQGWFYEVTEQEYAQFEEFMKYLRSRMNPLTTKLVRLDIPWDKLP
jgi:hypothetical protein